MLHVLGAIVPIVVLVAVGYLLTRGGLFSRDDMSVLSRFVAKVAMPVLVFSNVAARPASDIFHPAYLLTYAGVGAVMYALAAVYTRVMRRPTVRGAFIGMGMGGTNNGFIGLPLFLFLFADYAGAAVGMGMIVDNVLLIPFGLFLAEHAVGQGSLGRRLTTTVHNVVTHPLVIAIALAILVSVVGLELPDPVRTSVELLASTSSGVALFVIGGLLVGLQVRGTASDIAVMVVGKLLVAPALAVGLVLVWPMLGLPALAPELRAAVVLLCALPTYSILPALSEQYGEADVSTGAMMLQTALSFLTLSGWMIALTAAGWL